MSDDARRPDVPEPGPLDLATEEEIVEELARRNAAVVVLRVSRKTMGADSQESYKADWRGGFTTCIGLVASAQARLAAILAARTQAHDGRIGDGES